MAMWLNHIGNRIAVVPLVVWTAYSLCAAIASRREAILWALATVVVLAPAWMIEQRYYIVALVVWVLLRKRLPPWLEGVQLVWTAMLAIAVFHMTRWGQYSLWVPAAAATPNLRSARRRARAGRFEALARQIVQDREVVGVQLFGLVAAVVAPIGAHCGDAVGEVVADQR
jgi:hypothetical protein